MDRITSSTPVVSESAGVVKVGPSERGHRVIRTTCSRAPSAGPSSGVPMQSGLATGAGSVDAPGEAAGTAVIGSAGPRGHSKPPSTATRVTATPAVAQRPRFRLRADARAFAAQVEVSGGSGTAASRLLRSWSSFMIRSRR